MPSVVVVDGNADLRFLIALLLRLDGRATVVGDAPDGDTAVSMVESTRPDIVVIDVTKGYLGGLDATRRIKQRWPGTKVVLMIRPADAPVRDKARQFGADALIDKMEIATALLPELGESGSRPSLAAS